MVEGVWQTVEGEGPLVATAIHDGHEVRDDVRRNLALPDAERLLEEDPYTGEWTMIAPTRIVGLRSRFEVDLNRPRETCVYITPADAWNLNVWRARPSDALIDGSRREYDAFYAEVRRVFTRIADRHGRFVVYDLHTYNHRRDGPDAPPADPEANPEVNVGTGTMDRARWSPVVDRFLADLRAFDFGGRRLDVRENVKFRGGQLSRWTHECFPEAGCSLAIEFKKFFMDEWTGELDPAKHQLILEALESTVPGVLEALAGLGLRTR